MNTPLISFIVPIYNIEQYVPQCVDSLLYQNFQDFEILLIDDGSTDMSVQICNQYQELDSRIKSLHKENGGLSDARNYGIRKASGKYIVFLDGDDFWEPDSLLNLAKSLEECPADITLFNFRTYDGVVYSNPCLHLNPDLCMTILPIEKAFESVLSDNPNFPWYAWKYAIRRDVFQEYEWYFEVGIVYEDAAWGWKALLYAQSMVLIDICPVNYRINRLGSITAKPSYYKESCKLKVIGDNISEIETSCLNPRLKVLLCDNFSNLFYSVLIFYFYLNKSDRQKLFPEIQSTMWVYSYSLQKKQVFVRSLLKCFRIRPTCFLLYLRSRLLNFLRK